MTVGYLFSGVVTHLPVLAVLIGGLILVATRRARLGRRSATLAQLGLGALVLGQILDIIWIMSLPQIIGAMDYSSRTYGLMTLVVGIVLALVVAAGMGLLIAALVTRSPEGPGGPFESPPPPYQEPLKSRSYPSPTGGFPPQGGRDVRPPM
ncbi:hypothetical protein [Nucisporomicrobium flavum]|uniref:hypothetical protein n=1 Tax=Nucisporomicrobium flavum TaxID=2785915 RepID=UPI0018F518BA|nr:hypothetical protein [Nucisporomicrobium flavum]